MSHPSVDDLFRAIRVGNRSGVARYIRSELPLTVTSPTGLTPLMAAVVEQRHQIVETLLGSLAGFSLRSHWVLRRPPRSNSKSLSEELPWTTLQPRDIDQRDAMGRSALFLAAERGDTTMIELLVQAGAHANLRDRRNQTPLHVAAEHNHALATFMLWQYGSAPDHQDVAGRTPLMLAAGQPGSDETVRTLLADCDANPNLADRSGQTPLMRAAAIGSRETTRTLLEHGADSRAVDRSGKSAYGLAVQSADVATMMLLQPSLSTRARAAITERTKSVAAHIRR
jgi:ankyrin repeat protein